MSLSPLIFPCLKSSQAFSHIVCCTLCHTCAALSVLNMLNPTKKCVTLCVSPYVPSAYLIGLLWYTLRCFRMLLIRFEMFLYACFHMLLYTTIRYYRLLYAFMRFQTLAYAFRHLNMLSYTYIRLHTLSICF